MNEPHDLPDVNNWVAAVQAAVNAVRAAGANSQVCFFFRILCEQLLIDFL